MSQQNVVVQSLFETRDPERAAAFEVRGKSATVAVVIPAFNEVATIRDVAVRALRQVDWIIVVDDGSDDGTAAAVADLPVVVLHNAAKLGKGASLRRGMAFALEQDASAIITLDGDGQHAPEDIPRLIAAHEQNEGALVIGARLHESSKIPRLRYLTNRFGNFWIAWAAGYPLTDSQSGFRLYPAAVLRTLRVGQRRARGFVWESEILIDAARAGVKSVSVAVSAIYPADRRRSYFRPVVDFTRIGRMVAWKILSRGFYVPGLIRSLQRPDRVSHR